MGRGGQERPEAKSGDEAPGTGEDQSPEGVAHGAEAEDDVQVVAHALNEVGEEAVRGLGHLLRPGLFYDVRLDLHRSHGGGWGVKKGAFPSWLSG